MNPEAPPIRLRVRELAEERQISMSQLSRRSGMTMPLIRRYWYGTKDGKSYSATPLHEVRLPVLGAIAATLGVNVGDLFDAA